MKINIELDVSDVFVDTSEGQTLDAALKESIKSEVVSRISNDVLRSLRERNTFAKVETEYRGILKKTIDSYANSEKYLADNKFANTVGNVITKKVSESVVSALRNDSEFIRAVAATMFAK